MLDDDGQLRAALRLGTMVGEPAKLDDDGLAELSRFLDFASGQFDLAMVRVDNELDRAALTEWLRARVATLTHLRLDELSENPLARLREKHEIGDVLLLTGLEGGADEAFRALNVQRDRLVEVAPVPWILAGHQQALSVFQQVAPDFCDLVSLHTTLATGPELPALFSERAWLPSNAHSGRWSSIESSSMDMLVEEAVKLWRTGQWMDARKVLERWVIRSHRDADMRRETKIAGLRLYGQVLLGLGDPDGARRMFEQALDLVSGDEGVTPSGAEVLGELARVLAATGDLTRARDLLERALAAQIAVSGTELSVEVAASLHELGSVLKAQGDLSGAREHFERALAISTQVFGTSEHPEVAASLHELASVLRAQGDLTGARERLEQSLSIKAQVFGTDEHPSVASSLHQLAGVLQAQGDLTGARNLIERSLSIQVKVFGTDKHPSVAASLHELAGLLQAQGDLEGARERLERSLAIKLEIFGAEVHPDVAASLHNLGNLLRAQGRFEEAIAVYRSKLDIDTKIYGTVDHYSSAETEVALAITLARTGQNEQAAKHFTHGMGVLASQVPSHPLYARWLRLLGRDA